MKESAADMLSRQPSSTANPVVAALSIAVVIASIHLLQWFGGHSLEIRCACTVSVLLVLVVIVFLPTLIDKYSEHQNWLRQEETRGKKAERARREALWATLPTASQVPAPDTKAATPRFAAEDPAMLAFLEEHGYVVVKGALSSLEVSKAKELLWEFLEQGNIGMQRTKPSTWGNESFCKFGSPNNGIVSGKQFGQSKLCWFVRQKKAVQIAFAKIWGIDSNVSGDSGLLCSFDGGNIFRPFHNPSMKEQSESWKTKGGWYHVDQGSTKRGRHCVQGLVSLYAATPQTGGLCVVPGSHHHHDELMSYAGFGKTDFVAVPRDDPQVHRAKLVCCESGDLVLWDSRTVHCNTPALEADVPTSATAFEALGYPAGELLRAVTYVCMTPKKLADAETLQMRKQAFVLGVGSSHWPSPMQALCHLPPNVMPVQPSDIFTAMIERQVEHENIGLIA